jgi:hypothetical protein
MVQEVPMFDPKKHNPKSFDHKMLRVTMTKLSLGALIAALGIFPACSINANDGGKGGEKHVDIKSPMGDLHVSEAVDIHDAGLTIYPGAKPAPKDDGDDKKSAPMTLPRKFLPTTTKSCRNTASLFSATAAGMAAT